MGITTKPTAIDAVKGFGDAAKTNMTNLDFTNTWTTRTGKYAILAVAGQKVDATYATADLSWFDGAADAYEVKDMNQLYGLGLLSHYITPEDYEAAKEYVANPEEYDFRKILEW